MMKRTLFAVMALAAAALFAAELEDFPFGTKLAALADKLHLLNGRKK